MDIIRNDRIKKDTLQRLFVYSILYSYDKRTTEIFMIEVYKGFKAVSSFDESKGVYVGHVSNSDDTIQFHGRSSKELERSFQFCVDTYLSICRFKGLIPSCRYSQHDLAFGLRLPLQVVQSSATVSAPH